MRRPKGPAPWGAKHVTRVLGGVRWVWRVDPWRGVSPPVATPLCSYCGCPECRVAEVEVEKLKEPVPRSGVPGNQSAPVEVPKLLAKFPCIADLLLSPCWESGTQKGSPCLFVFPSSSLVKLLVKVENPPLKMLVTGRTWDEAWASLETILRGDDVPWEQDGPRDDRPRKKKK